MNLEAILVLCVLPAFASLAGAVGYLWRAQVKMHKELLDQKEEQIESLKKDRAEASRRFDEIREHLHKNEIETAKLEAKFLVLQASHLSSPLPQWMKDLDGIVLACNAAYSRMFLEPRGYALADYLNHRDSDVWPNHVAAVFEKNDKIVARTGIGIDTREPVTDGDGKDVMLRVIKWPRKSGGVIIGIDGIVIPDDSIF